MELLDLLSAISKLILCFIALIVLLIVFVKMAKYDAAKDGAMDALKEFGFERKVKDEPK